MWSDLPYVTVSLILQYNAMGEIFMKNIKPINFAMKESANRKTMVALWSPKHEEFKKFVYVSTPRETKDKGICLPLVGEAACEHFFL